MTTFRTATRAASALMMSTALVAGPALAQEATTITVATHYTPEQMGAVLECFAQYEADHPGTTIEFQQASYSDFLQTILTARIGGTSPDIYNIYSIWAPQLADAGTLVEPPAEVQDWIRSAYGDGAVGAATINGTLYGIPTEMSVYQLFYNKALLAAAGYDAPPATWDELMEIAEATTVINDDGNIEVAGYAYGPTVANAVHVFYSQMYAEGVPPYGEDGMTTNFTSPEAIAILEGQRALFENGYTATAVETDDFYASGAAMTVMANWTKYGLQDAYGDAFEDTVGIAPIPTHSGPGGTMLYSFLWAVDSTSDVQDESWALLEWLNTQQAEGELSCTGQMMSDLGALTGNLADLAAMDTDDSFTAPFVAAVESGAAQTQPNVWQASENDRILRSYIEMVWSGEMSAADAMEAADAEITAILAEQG